MNTPIFRYPMLHSILMNVFFHASFIKTNALVKKTRSFFIPKTNTSKKSHHNHRVTILIIIDKNDSEKRKKLFLAKSSSNGNLKLKKRNVLTFSIFSSIFPLNVIFKAVFLSEYCFCWWSFHMIPFKSSDLFFNSINF